MMIKKPYNHVALISYSPDELFCGESFKLTLEIMITFIPNNIYGFTDKEMSESQLTISRTTKHH